MTAAELDALSPQATKELIASLEALIEHTHAQSLRLADDRHRLMCEVDALHAELEAEKRKRRGTAEILLPPRGTL